MRSLYSFALFCSLAGAQTALLDRLAASVNNKAITEDEVIEEIRVTAFLNRQEPDFSPDARRAATERLIDQYLVRQEIDIGGYPPA